MLVKLLPIIFVCILHLAYFSNCATIPISSITGKYNMIKSDNFDAYMRAVGANWFLIVAGSNAKPVQQISENSGNWNIKTTTTFKKTNIDFKLDIPFNEVTADGRTCRATITLLEDTLIQKQHCAGKDYQISRKFDAAKKEMKMTLTAPGPVVATRVYKRV